MTFVLVDAYFFKSKKVNFMADLRKKYACRSAVALVETHSFDITFCYFYVLCWHRVM